MRAGVPLAAALSARRHVLVAYRAARLRGRCLANEVEMRCARGMPAWYSGIDAKFQLYRINKQEMFSSTGEDPRYAGQRMARAVANRLPGVERGK